MSKVNEVQKGINTLIVEAEKGIRGELSFPRTINLLYVFKSFIQTITIAQAEMKVSNFELETMGPEEAKKFKLYAAQRLSQGLGAELLKTPQMTEIEETQDLKNDCLRIRQSVFILKMLPD